MADFSTVELRASHPTAVIEARRGQRTLLANSVAIGFADDQGWYWNAGFDAWSSVQRAEELRRYISATVR